MPRKRKPSKETRTGDRARSAIDCRIAKDKSLLIAQLKKNPSLYLAFEKVGIGKRTYYRWRREDRQFDIKAESAIRDAIALRNDFVESKLLVGLKEGNMRAIKFWLSHRHPAYGAKVKIEKQRANSDLTPEQKEQIRRSLRLAGLE